LIFFIYSEKKDCENCRYEQNLLRAKDELESTLDVKIVKLQNSHLKRVYDFNHHESALVFIRKGIPLLYPDDGEDDANEIFEFFSQYREPVVKELDDTNFEHLTQASTGSTTGDWLIQFYDSKCVDCNRLIATWETVGARLKTRMNVAKVNSGTKGIQTGKRFKIDTNLPTFLLLRQGKIYRYNLKKYDIESFVGFATSWFAQISPEKVPVPKTAFDMVLETVVLKLKDIPAIKENPIIIVGLASFSFLLIFIVLLSRNRKPAEGEVKVSKKQK
jgi:hypothetical protein